MTRDFASRSTLALVVSVGLATMLVATSASAQSVTLDQFHASALATDGFAISRPDDFGHRRFGAQLTFDYGLNPLVYETTPGDANTEFLAVVEHQLVAHLGLAFGVANRLVIFAGLPVSAQSGDVFPSDFSGIASADGPAVGDAQLGLRLRLFGERDDVFALSLQAIGTAPLAAALNDAQHYTGEPDLTLTPAILAEVRGGPVRVTANFGARLRPDARVPTLTVSSEFVYGLGVTITLARRPTHSMLDLQIEAYGATSFADFGAQTKSPLEAIIGFKLSPSCTFHVGLAGGAGLLRGYGAPDLRGVLSIGYANACAEVVAEPIPTPPAAVDPDRDHDGIPNDAELCPDEPEDMDGFEDTDGCPDLDNDNDGVPDVRDGAPNDAEDMDGFEDTDGVPDLDNDHDGVPDATDQCALVAEDLDGIQDEDGCPEEDADGDQVLDAVDRCPLTPGVHNAAHPECDGCPALACMSAEGTITIWERVEFATGSERILTPSEPVLQAVQQILETNAQIHRLRIEGHTDDRGNDGRNLALSQRRAESVASWLIAHGIAAERLEALGLGETRPLVPNRTARNRQTNRRVEFHITDPAPPAAAATPAP